VPAADRKGQGIGSVDGPKHSAGGQDAVVAFAQELVRWKTKIGMAFEKEQQLLMKDHGTKIQALVPF
jgi:hypothetical protein